MAVAPLSASDPKTRRATGPSHRPQPPPSSPRTLAARTQSSSSPSSFPGTSLLSAPFSKVMIRLWPSSASDQLTPRAGPNGRERTNPFEDAVPRSSYSSSSSTPHTPTLGSFHHHLLNAGTPPQPSAIAAASPTLTGPGPGPASGNFAASPSMPTTQLSLHAPNFAMRRPPPPKSSMSHPSSSTAESSPTHVHPPPPQPTGPSRGQIHVKLISARGLNVPSIHSRPYVVVQFEQNEFVSRDPTAETDKEVKGTAMPAALSRVNSSIAVSALSAIGSKVGGIDVVARNGRGSGGSTPSSSVSSNGKSPLTPHPHPAASNTLFGRLSAHNPVWKHEVSFDVTSEESVITFNVYDRANDEHGFLGTFQIKPVLIHDHTVDQWYKLRPFENENVSGEMRVQITFEQTKTRRALTPRDFEFLKLIGRGTFGKVFQVRKRDTKRIYAMKVLSKKEIVAKKEVAHTIGERKILQRSLESPFLVGLKFSFQTDTDLYLVTDFKSGGELFWHLQKETRFTEDRARFYIAELVLALEHLHKYNIIYRDLKPENILLDATGHVALCDFGLSKADLRSDELTTTFCGTTEYLAPEVLLDEHGYSKLVDFWSLGVLLFEMCCGWSPFYAEDTQTMYRNICFGKIRFPRNVISEDGKQFVKGLLNRNPKHRLGAQRDAAELKEHPFFNSIDWKALSLKQVTPPFKPVVESDESTANFDPEFTTADIREVGLRDMDLDEEDPSEAWVSQSIGGSGFVHTPNGPLGSDKNGVAPLSPALLTTSNGPVRPGIQIVPRKRKDAAGSPLTNSVQENFRGFTYSGGESVVPPSMMSGHEEGEDDEAVVDEEVPEITTDEEYEDGHGFAGRYSTARRVGLATDDMLE